ncbi:TPM domain-containing protein [Microbulbifer spongiae]|uniref:TPM domain-containing protein n=1 Tax=Microbulbifer spongiae TaxID=2944933 RepID=A0ABY9EE11_9GAMM|nr:TPM domain-containing protein [Microbulbifer sp. MI-G]WKD50877.1 TPM domain-containing protein [Microbulbifer sp. MI-G]
MNGSGPVTLSVMALLFTLAAQADIYYPPLSGHVVDRAKLLAADERYQLTELIQQYESDNSNQLVVAILPELHGITIEEYAHQLARHWKLGHKGKHNGVLFLVAPRERKVCIEVGDGLESTLTKALAANIIQTKVLPMFQSGDFAGGINVGVQSIIAATKNEYVTAPLETKKDRRMTILLGLLLILIMLQLFGTSILSSPIHGPGYKRGRFGGYYGSGGFGSGYPSQRSGDRFSGGDGGFGGGGASGGW